MTTDDLQRIEEALGVALPPTYREAMLRFPEGDLAGNADTEVWDDAEALIERNRELRAGERAWPAHLFFIGDPLTACAYAIDLNDPAAPVWWVDHGDLDAPSSGVIAPAFEPWADALLAERLGGGTRAADVTGRSAGPGCAAGLAGLLLVLGSGAWRAG